MVFLSGFHKKVFVYKRRTSTYCIIYNIKQKTHSYISVYREDCVVVLFIKKLMIFPHLYVIKANASPTKLTELPRTTPSATRPPCDPHAFEYPYDTLVAGGNPWMCPV